MKSLFRQERQSRSNIHSQQKRMKDENREVVKATAFGGATTELQEIANQLIGSDNPTPNSMAT